MKKIFKILKVFLIIIVVLIIVGVLLVMFYKPLGGIPSKKDIADYEKRAVNMKNGKFYNDDFSMYSDYKDKYSDRTTGKGTTPKEKLKSEKFNYISDYDKDDVLITWFGHSTVLIQIHGKNILVDPVFSDRTSPVSFIGPKRYSTLPASIDDLPDIDIILLTHDHYDHVDYKSLKKLSKKTDKFIVPLGIDKDLEKFGINKDKITNMAWWEEYKDDGIVVACTPSRHFSGRFLFDSSTTLWSSWIIKDEYNTIFDSGDTGYGDHFKEISEKYNDISLSLLDSSQYNERWHSVHMFPEEAVQASIDLKTKVAMAVHWGAFVLSNHAWDDPADRFTRRALEENVEYMQPKLGQTVSLKEYKKYQEKWWKEIE